MKFTPGFKPSGQPAGEEVWFIFCGNKLLVKADGPVPLMLSREDAAHIEGRFLRTQFIGSLDDVPCFAAELADDFQPAAGMAFKGLRSFLGVFDETLFAAAGRAFQIIDWDRTHRYCSRCGNKNRLLELERALACSSCGRTVYPPVTPAIIVAVTKGREILLAQSPRFQGQFYSVLAGFVEPGETIEECVKREVREEVGIDVGNIRYFGSQPWPFPHNLMLGFTAEYVSGDIVIDTTELLDARWYAADSLPAVPRHGTIARRLIDAFRAGAAA